MRGAVLQDERSERRLRRRIGELLSTATTADLALARVRLSALDLTEEEVAGPNRCRVLLGQLDASTLLEAAAAAPGSRAPALVRLARWLGSDRLEVRSAGIAAWTPDFSLYTRPDGTTHALVGAHYFGSPQLTVGPSFTALLEDPAAERLLRGRFDELWERAHDVAPAIMDVLREVGGGGGKSG